MEIIFIWHEDIDGLTKLSIKNQSYMPLDVFEKSKTENTFLSVTFSCPLQRRILKKGISLRLRQCLIIMLETITGKNNYLNDTQALRKIGFFPVRYFYDPVRYVYFKYSKIKKGWLLNIFIDIKPIHAWKKYFKLSPISKSWMKMINYTLRVHKTKFRLFFPE